MGINFPLLSKIIHFVMILFKMGVFRGEKASGGAKFSYQRVIFMTKKGLPRGGP